MGIKLPRVKPGDLILAEHYQQLAAATEKVANLRVEAPLELFDVPGGYLVRLAKTPDTWIKITGSPSGTAYAWTEQVPQSGGTWTNGPRSGTTSVDPAYEANGSTSVPANRIVRARRNDGGAWIFEFGEC